MLKHPRLTAAKPILKTTQELEFNTHRIDTLTKEEMGEVYFMWSHWLLSGLSPISFPVLSNTHIQAMPLLPIITGLHADFQEPLKKEMNNIKNKK